tara:strand:+ start:871 stop:2286 length:1416 start_codon:yes stop_codon:yes gene_type:complete
MSVTLKFLSTGNAKFLTPAYSDIVVQASNIPSNIYNNKFNVKYLCSIIVNGTTVATLKAVPNPNANRRALFRIQSILQDFTQTDKLGFETSLQNADSTFNGQFFIDAPHAIHQIDKYARNKENLRHVFCLGGYEYSETVNSEIEQVFSLDTDAQFLFLNSVAQHVDGFSSTDYTDYMLTAGNKKFLSIFPNIFSSTNKGQKIQGSQYHTLAFFNGKHFLDSEVTRIRIQTYDSDDVLIDEKFVDNTNANGGAAFGSNITYNNFTNAGNTDEGLLYFGCGTAQLKLLGFNLANVSSYFVRALNVSNNVSNSYRFDIQAPDCKGFETIRLAFLNRLGTYDYYNFTKKSIRTTQIQKSPIKQNYGHQTENSTNFAGALQNLPIYTQGTYDGGTRTFNVNAIETIEANTDFITEEEATILEELFTSSDVYMQTGSTFEPVVINETEYIKQTTANDMLKQYIITIEKAHNTRVQRI